MQIKLQIFKYYIFIYIYDNFECEFKKVGYFLNTRKYIVIQSVYCSIIERANGLKEYYFPAFIKFVGHKMLK